MTGRVLSLKQFILIASRMFIIDHLDGCGYLVSVVGDDVGQPGCLAGDERTVAGKGVLTADALNVFSICG